MQLGHRAGRAIGGCRRAGTGSVHRGKGLRRHTGGDGCSLPWATGVAGPRPRLASRSDGLALAGLGVFANRGRWRLGRLWLPGLGGGGVAREVRIVASFGAHELAPGVERLRDDRKVSLTRSADEMDRNPNTRFKARRATM